MVEEVVEVLRVVTNVLVQLMVNVAERVEVAVKSACTPLCG